MFEYFTVQGREELTKLKADLLVHPADYFSKNLDSFSELKEVYISILSLQWQFLSSGLSLVLDTFKALGEAAYSLLMFNFAVSREQFSKAAKAALAALTKLNLEPGLLLLHTIRLLTLLIANFFPQLAVLGIVTAAIVASYLPFPVIGLYSVAIAGAVISLCAASLLFIENIKFPKEAKRAHSHKYITEVLRDLDNCEQVVEEFFKQRREN